MMHTDQPSIWNHQPFQMATNEPPTFRQLFTTYAEQTDDVVQIASAICTQLRLTPMQRSILWGIILDACRNMERSRVRRVEQVASPQRAGRQVDPTAERAQLMEQTFSLGDGRRVLWGEATIADHEARIDFLSKKRDGLDDTIQRHRGVVEQLRATGASCLNELLERAQ